MPWGHPCQLWFLVVLSLVELACVPALFFLCSQHHITMSHCCHLTAHLPLTWVCLRLCPVSPVPVVDVLGAVSGLSICMSSRPASAQHHSAGTGPGPLSPTLERCGISISQRQEELSFIPV